MVNMRVVGCLVECDGEILLLHRGEMEDESHTYSLVSGRVEEGESDIQAMLRELEEETGYVAKEWELQYLREFNWIFGKKKVDFPLYKLVLSEKIDVKHQKDEHQGYKWVKYEDVMSLPVIHGMDDVIKFMGY